MFSGVDFSYIPGHLILRDPETQVLLKRERFAGVSGKDLPVYAASRFEESPFDSIVGIAPKGSKNFASYMKDVEWLYGNALADYEDVPDPS